MKKVPLIAVLVLALSMSLAACQTPTPMPTSTPMPTFTPTSTPMPISTPMPTLTPTLGIGSIITSDKDGMTMVFVPAGKFTMGNKAEDALTECQKYRSDCQLVWFNNEQPPHEVDLSAFWIDQTEVTNAMYAKCVSDGACKEPSDKGSSTHPSYYGNSEFTNYPVIRVNWNMAKTYCEWRGDRLPTEAEWEKAASWDDVAKTKRIYPWGDSINCSYANYYDSKASKNCVGDTTAIKSYEDGKSLYGAYDMAGNVWEWVSSLHKSYPYVFNDGRENLSDSDFRVLRGGSWNYLDNGVRSADRNFLKPSYTSVVIGFRCARSLP